MLCSNCQFDNPTGFAFCGQCGTPLNQRPHQLTPTDLDHLRAYLPAMLIEALQFDLAQPMPDLIAKSTHHLADLLQTTMTYLPHYVVDSILRDATPGRNEGQFVSGSLLFADISGFTALSENLGRSGREGAEEITVIVNRYFSAMLMILREHAGQLVKFGGDALLGLFLEPGGAMQAIQAAMMMQSAMAEFAEVQTSRGRFPLQMKVGIHRGRFFAAQLGTRRDMEATLLGSDVNAAAAAETAALRGEVLIDRATREALQASCQLTSVQRHDTEYFIVDEIAQAPQRNSAAATHQRVELEPTLCDVRRAVKLLERFPI
jgi:class 3 adenylate cyclase